MQKYNTYLLIGVILFITIGIFLGDGKQHIIDIFGTGSIIALFLYAKTYCKKNQTLPNNIVLLWTIVLAYFGIRTLFSDDVGYSITATMRMMMGYFIFKLSYEYLAEDYTELFTKAIKILSVFAFVAALFFFFFPEFATFLPLMNLLYANYGHNYLANIVVFVYPVALLAVINKPPKIAIGYFLLLLLALFFSFSRGAQLLIGLYTIFQLGLLRPKKISFNLIIIFVTSFVSIFSIIIFSFVTISSLQPTTVDHRIRKQTIKTPLTNEGRIKYWTQALQAIKERPILGSGPGTFYLQSKRLQQQPNEFSWFAHNYFLELLTEVGIIGTIGIVVILYLILTNTSSASPLKVGLLLTLLYSMIEFNMNFLVIWLLFWTTCGIVLKSSKLQRIKSIRFSINRILLLLVVLYYSSSILHVISEQLHISPPIAFYINPFDVQSSKTLISYHQEHTIDLSATEKNVLLTFHGKDPDILGMLADLYKKLKNPQETEHFYIRTIQADPINTTHHFDYINYLLSEPNSLSKLEQEIQQLNNIFLSKSERTELESISALQNAKHLLFTKDNVNNETASPGIDYYVSFYYKFGLSLLDTDPIAVKKMWTIMYNLNPGWSYFYIDFASLMKYVYHDNTQALIILQTCQKHSNAGKHCREYTLETLPTHSVLRETTLFN